MEQADKQQTKNSGSLLEEPDVLCRLLELCEESYADPCEIELLKDHSQPRGRLK